MRRRWARWTLPARRAWWRWAQGLRSADGHGITAAQREVLSRRWYLWEQFSPAEKARMERLIGLFLTSMRWEGARGFTVTAEMQVLVAAQACLLLLGLPIDEFPATDAVILHPGTVRLRGEHHLDGGVRAAGVLTLDGQAHYRGPVLLSWAAARAEMNAPRRGRNVVFHEFAHQLDMIDGSVDGTPPFSDDAARERWIAVCTEAFERRSGDPAGESTASDTTDAPEVGAVEMGPFPQILRDYATTNPAEFFSVATEEFFCRPGALREAEPALYVQFAEYFGQDPAQRSRPGRVTGSTEWAAGA